MFKIKKEHLSFGLTLCSKALAQRQQEDVVYRSVRLTTFSIEGKSYLAMMSNGGYNAVKTAGFPITELTEEMDVLVECQKLLDVVGKSTVDELKFDKINDENIKVTANGENKLRYSPGELIAPLPKYEEGEAIGTLQVKAFSQLCKLTVPFATMDIHKAPLIGLCIVNKNLYATDEYKAITVTGIGLEIPRQLNFSPIIADMIALFDAEDKIQFYLGKMQGGDDYTHLVANIDGMELFILKYQTEYPSDILDQVNEKCIKNNTSLVSIVKGDALKSLNRIAVFADENDLLALTPVSNGFIVQVINAKTGEESKEHIEGKSELQEGVEGNKFYMSLTNFKVVLENVDADPVAIRFCANANFVSVKDGNYLFWIVTKRVE